MDTPKRSILKVISWRLIAFLVTALIVWFTTGMLTAAVAVSGIDLLIKTVFQYGHERAWEHIEYGKEKE